MSCLFPAQITMLEPVAKRPGWVRIRINTGPGPMLTEARIVELAIRIGTPWTASLEQACKRAAIIDDLKQRALRLLTKTARSRQQLRDRLMHADIDPNLVESALDELQHAGLVDDRAFAHGVVATGLQTGPGRRYLLERKLAMAGVAHDIVKEVLHEVGPDPEEDARRLVESKLSKMPNREPRVKTAARLARLLASRGFDEHIARDAIEAVMGTIEDDETANLE